MPIHYPVRTDRKCGREFLMTVASVVRRNTVCARVGASVEAGVVY